MRLIDALATTLGSAIAASAPTAPRNVRPGTPGAATNVVTAPLIVQPSAFPTAINAATYANPRTPENPNGSLLPLYTFRSLVDPVPALATCYSAGPISTEVAYGNLVHGATVPRAGSTFTREVLAAAQRQFDLVTFPSLDGTPGDPWRPVYAEPPDWYAADASRYAPLSLAEGEPASAQGYTLIGATGSAAEFTWRVLGGKGNGVALDPQTKILSASLHYLTVTLTRPWMDFSLFSLRGWVLEGEPAGLYSSGSTSENTGLMPLMPTALVLGIDARVTASWGPGDSALLTHAAANQTPLALGPIPLRLDPAAAKPAAATLESAQPFVVAWICTLVPLAPSAAG